MSDLIPVPQAPAPDVLRCAYMEIVVTDLARSREFYVDVLGLVVTEEDENAIYLRSFEEFIHHNLVLRQGPVAAVAAFGFRVRSQEDVDKAEAYYRELGCETRRGDFTEGVRNAVRVSDPLGFTYEFFTRSTTSSASPGATTSRDRAPSSASTTSTRSTRTSSRAPPTSTPSASRPPRPSATPTASPTRRG